MTNFFRCFSSSSVLVGFALTLVAQVKPASPNQQNLPTIAAQPPAQIVPPPPDYKFPAHQTYVYGVEWHLFTAGTASVGLQDNGLEQKVVATAVSSGVASALYKVNDRFEAFFDPRKFCSQRVLKHIEEGSHSRQS